MKGLGEEEMEELTFLLNYGHYKIIF